MKEDTADTNHKNDYSRALPIIVTLCMLLCIGVLLFVLWSKAAERQRFLHTSIAAKNAEIESLLQRKTEFEELLQLEPCTLRQRLDERAKQSAPESGMHDPSASSSAGRATPAPLPAVTDNAAQGGTPDTTPSPSVTASKDESVDRVENATVFIIVEDGEGLGTGTGFFVAPDMVMTNAHVVGNAPARILIINGKLGAPVSATVVGIERGQSTGGRDYALLRVPAQHSIQPLALRDTPRRTENVYAWGYPFAVSRSDPKYQALMRGQKAVAPEVIFSAGVVSAIMERTPPFIVHTALLSHGNSGGPLTDENGLVVGINTAGSTDDRTSRQTSIALPASDFINFLRENGVAVTLVTP